MLSAALTVILRNSWSRVPPYPNAIKGNVDVQIAVSVR
jgi:hypothetical protein